MTVIVIGKNAMIVAPGEIVPGLLDEAITRIAAQGHHLPGGTTTIEDMMTGDTMTGGHHQGTMITGERAIMTASLLTIITIIAGSVKKEDATTASMKNGPRDKPQTVMEDGRVELEDDQKEPNAMHSGTQKGTTSLAAFLRFFSPCSIRPTEYFALRYDSLSTLSEPGQSLEPTNWLNRSGIGMRGSQAIYWIVFR